MSHPASKQEDIVIFANHCVFMLSIYHHLRCLFETSNDDDHKRLQKTAHIFFGDLHQMLVEYLVLQVCRITDPAKDMRSNDNHTLAFLLDYYGLRGDATIGKQVEGLESTIMVFRKKLLPARNKLIGHADRDAILAGKPLGETQPGDWEKFWVDLDQIVDMIHQRIMGAEMKLSQVAMISDADGLLKALWAADCFEAMLGDADAAVKQRAAQLVQSR